LNVDVSRASRDVDKQARDALFILASGSFNRAMETGIEIELSFSLERNDAGSPNNVSDSAGLDRKSSPDRAIPRTLVEAFEITLKTKPLFAAK